MTEQEKIGLTIEDYLANRLQGKALEDFKKELDSNPSLRAEVEMHRLANGFILDHKMLNISSLAREVEQDIKRKERLKWASVIGAAIIGLGILLYFTLNKENTSSVAPKESPIAAPSVPNTVSSEGVAINESTSATAETPNTAKKEIQQAQNKVSTLETEKTSETPVVESKSTSTTENLRSSETQNPVAVAKELEKAGAVKNLCENIHIKATISTKNTCYGQENGEILIGNVNGGNSPYKTIVYDESGHKTNSIKHLSKGNYVIEIIDNEQCSQKFPSVHVQEVHCNEDFHFNPFIGETWSFPSIGLACTLKIYDKSTGLHFDKSFNSHEQLQWDGHSNQGEMKAGYFVLEISYADGSKKGGSITVVK